METSILPELPVNWGWSNMLGIKLAMLFRYFACIAAAVALLFVPTPAASASSGTLNITSNTTLTEDHHGNIQILSVDNVTLDCAGHKVLGPGLGPDDGFSGGINIAQTNGVTVKDCVVSGFGSVNGIFSGGGSNLRLEGNTLVGNANHGIHVDAMVGGVVTGNVSRSNGAFGIVMTGSSQSSVANNSARNNNTDWAGIALLDSHDNVVVDNISIRNGIGFYLENAVDNALRSNTAHVNNTAGFLLRGASDNVLDSNKATGNLIGFEITNLSSFNTVTGNLGRGSRSFDAVDDGSGTGNVWMGNNFGKTTGI